MEEIRLETERLILRPWRLEDAADMYEYAKDPEVGLNGGWPPHESVKDSEAILRDWVEKGVSEEYCNLALEYEGRAIGSVGFEEDARRPVSGVRILGYALGKDYWGRGLMTEAARAVITFAFEQTSLRLLAVTHYADNLRSKRVIEKCGFTYEGTLRRAAPRFDGVVKDLCCYSMTAEEYRKIRREKA